MRALPGWRGVPRAAGNRGTAFLPVAELADSSVNFKVRNWVQASVFFGMQAGVKMAFGKHGVQLFPQMDVHMQN